MNKLKLLLVSLGILLLIWIVSWFKIFGIFSPSKEVPTSPTPTTAVTQDVSVSIVFGDRDSIEFTKDINGQDVNAFEVLKEAVDTNGLKMDTQKYEFGIFVKSIESYKSGADKAWIYFVNGKSGSIAADKYKLEPADKVEWKYIAPSGE